MVIQKVKAFLRGITLDEQLLAEKQRLLNEINMLVQRQPNNFLTSIRDAYGFGRLKQSLINHLIIISLSVAVYYSTDNVYFSQGLLIFPSLSFIAGIVLLIRYPVSIKYFLGRE